MIFLLFALPSWVPATTLAQAAPAAAAAASTGTITGIVVDASNQEPIIEAGVEVVGLGKKIRTGIDGDFTIKLPPGTYQLRVFAPLYNGERLQNVVVEVGQTTKVNAKLKPQGEAAVETVEVVAAASKAAETTQMIKRKQASVVSETVSAQVIEKSPDSDAAEVVQRVPAVTVRDNKYIYVRGLGERYSSALLDGSRLPSTDPNKRVVPLDLFPAQFIESLSIAKGYTPDLPGDFSGGLVDLRLKEFPEKLTYSIGMSTGVNTAVTFQGTQTYQGSDIDWLGFGSDFRALPDEIPDKATINGTSQLDRAAQNRAYASAFRNDWSVRSTSAPPNTGLNFSIGNSFGPLGAQLGIVYGNEYNQRRGEINRVYGPEYFTNPETFAPRQDLLVDRSIFETRLGAVLTSGYKISDQHRIGVRGFINRNSADEISTKIGTEERSIQEIRPVALEYREEQLGYTQISGEHQWDLVAVDWRTAYSVTTQDIPDRRAYRYVRATGSSEDFNLDSTGPSAPNRTFLNLDETMSDSGLDVTVPFKTALPGTELWRDLPAKLKVGAAYTERTRNVEYNRYVFEARSGTGALDLRRPLEEILQPENLGSLFPLRDDTRIPDDSFRATQEIAGVYAMLELPILADRLRVVGGLRGEYSYITTRARTASRLNDFDPIPGANVIFSPRDDMNIRYGYSRTVTRPDFRELTSTEYVPEEGKLLVRGNQALVSGQVESHDLRWEWFLSPLEIVSVGIFYKDLVNPIEDAVTTLNDKPVAGFLNAPTGELYGAEVELRKNLVFAADLLGSGSALRNGVADQLRRTTLNTNVSFIESQVSLNSVLPDGSENVATNLRRSLQGQSPFTVNAALDYEIPERGTARMLYTTSGRRIALSGYNKMPDIYDEMRHQLDFVVTSKIQPFDIPLNAKFAVENILNDRFKRTQGDFLETRFRTGVRFAFGLSYAF